MAKKQRYIVVMDATENGRPIKFYVSRPGSAGYRMGYSCQRHIAAEFTKAEAEKYAARFNGPNRKVTILAV